MRGSVQRAPPKPESQLRLRNEKLKEISFSIHPRLGFDVGDVVAERELVDRAVVDLYRPARAAPDSNVAMVCFIQFLSSRAA